MVNSIVKVTAKEIEVFPPGSSSFSSFQKRLVIPLPHIIKVSMGKEAKDEKMMSSQQNGINFFKRFLKPADKDRTSAQGSNEASEYSLLIQLKDEKFEKLVLGVENPEKIIQEIIQAQQLPVESVVEIAPYDNAEEKYSKSDRLSQLALDLLVILGLASVFLQFIFPEEDRLAFFNDAAVLIIVLVLINILLRILGRRSQVRKNFKKQKKFILHKVVFGLLLLTLLLAFFGQSMLPANVIQYLTIAEMLLTFIFLGLYFFVK